jgi:hypothetical protein
MELLATVDWLMVNQSIEPSFEGVKSALQHWPGGKSAARRKLSLFDDRFLSVALERLVANN